RDNTFTIARVADTYRLTYRSLGEPPSPPLLFAGIYGLRFPSYDRVNGASVPFGPAFSFAGGRGEIDVLGTYRSDLGKVDPSANGAVPGVLSAERTPWECGVPIRRSKTARSRRRWREPHSVGWRTASSWTRVRAPR